MSHNPGIVSRTPEPGPEPAPELELKPEREPEQEPELEHSDKLRMAGPTRPKRR